MGRKQTIYIPSELETSYDKYTSVAQTLGKTCIDYLINQMDEYQLVRQKMKKQDLNKIDKEGFTTFTLSLGETLKNGKSYISFQGKLLADESIDKDMCVKLYKGIHGGILVFFTLSDRECDYRLTETPEEAIDIICNLPNTLEIAGFEAQDEEEQVERIKIYQDVANKICTKLNLPLVGDDIAKLIF